MSRLVLSSSMVVYGEGATTARCTAACGRSPGPSPISTRAVRAALPACGGACPGPRCAEDAALDPRNVYATTKLAQEHLAANWARLTGGTAVALRYHNVYGPRMPRDTPYSGVAAIFRSCLEGGEAPRVFEDGGQRRDFVHVRDVAEGNVLALAAPPSSPRASCAPTTWPAAPRTPSARWPPSSPSRSPAARSSPWSPASTGSATSGTSWPHRRPPRGLGFRAQTGFAEGVAEFAHAPLRAPARVG